MKINLIVFILLTLGYSNVNFTYNGNFSHFFALRNSNNKILNIPFRMLELNANLQIGNNFELSTLLSTEYHNTNDDYFNVDNINNEVRELYGTYYFNFGEIGFGRKLFTLGSVDENSPIDHFNPYNYYYLLLGGIDKKVSINALSFELYLGDKYRLFGALSPDHNKNEYPQNDPEYSLGLSISPESNEILDNKGSQHEAFLSLQVIPNNNSEITLTHLRAFDRIFALSGFTLYEFNGDNAFHSESLDSWFSYRLTETFSLGSVLLFDDFTIRTDFAYFNSFDRYNRHDYLSLKSTLDLLAETELYTELFDGWDIDGDNINDSFNAALQEKAKYSQFTFQLELPLPNNWQLNMQYFRYNLIDYTLNNYTFSEVTVQLPNATVDLNDFINDEGKYFTPSFGSSMATLSEKSILFGIEKYMLDNSLKLTSTTFFDLGRGNGKLMSFELDYEITDRINLIFGSTKIFGDNNIELKNSLDFYTFNLMEDFSHNRLQLNYYF